MDKKYGLQLRKPKNPPSRPPLPNPLGFGGDDGNNDVEGISRQQYKNKSLKDVEEQHKKALEEDPSAFDYDGVYDEMKQKAARPLANDRQERKPKYIQAILEKSKQREREHEIIYERKLAKERGQDDHLYADKDKFVTSAYKKQLAEQAKWLEEERVRELREQREDVTKNTDISDFYFNLKKNVAFGGGEDQFRKPEKSREEMVSKSPENVLPSRNVPAESSMVIKRHESENSLSPRKQSVEMDHKHVSDASAQGKATDEPPVPEQPRGDHHKRNQDALAAAKERFLARKKAKDQLPHFTLRPSLVLLAFTELLLGCFILKYAFLLLEFSSFNNLNTCNIMINAICILVCLKVFYQFQLLSFSVKYMLQRVFFVLLLLFST